MISLTGAKIKTTTYPDSVALQSFYSYTLPNTPFYFSLQWLTNDESYRNKFSRSQILWDFGDGTYHTGETAEHFYKWPGKYLVTATLYDIEGNTHSLFSDNFLDVYNAVPDVTTLGDFQDVNLSPLLAGKKSAPLKMLRYNSWQYDNELSNNNYTVYLYASGCRSNFISVSSFYTSSWSHLKSYFGFIQETINVNNFLEDRVVESTETTSVSVYAERVNTGFINNNWDVKLRFYGYPEVGTAFCGTSGELADNKNIYFTDQKPSLNSFDSFIILYASTDTRIFKNQDYLKYNYKSDDPYGFVNYPYSAQFLKSLFNPATDIKITSNGISVEGPTPEPETGLQKNYSFDIYPIKFTNSKINFVCTLKDSENYTTKCYPELILNNTASLSVNNINVSLVEFKNGGIEKVNSAVISKNHSVPNFEESGSYFAGLLECPEEKSVVALSATALIIDDAVAPPSNNIGFIMQPGLNLFRKVKSVYSYGYQNNSEKFSVNVDSIIETFFADVSGGVNITLAPLYLNDPLSGGYVWITNSSKDSLTVFDINGNQILNTLFFRRLRVFQQRGDGGGAAFIVDALGDNKSASPCNVAIDSNGDAWVTLRDTISSFKIDKNTLIATKTIVPSVKNIKYYSYNDYLSLSGFAGEDLIQPSSIDIDTQDNVYISYTNTLCSFIVKYDKDGKELENIPFNFPNTVKQLLIDAEDGLWVTTFNNNSLNEIQSPPQTTNITNRVDQLYYIDLKNPTNNFIVRLSMLGDLTMDSGGNVWVSNKNNTISKITKDGGVESYTMGNRESALDYVQDFGGIAGDVEGNLWVVNNSEGVLQFFDTKSPQQLKPNEYDSVVLPDIYLSNSSEGTFSYYQTIGDFTGIRWAVKNRKAKSTFPRLVTGISNYFTIKKPTTSLVKKDENFDISSTVRSYALQESLFNNSNLFNGFFEPILNGTDTDNVNQIGKVLYERISNFVNNNADIDTCNINALKSMYGLVGEEFNNLAYTLPPSIRRVIDILSIKKCILYGNFNTFNRNFLLSTFEHSLETNLGTEIDIKNGYFIPGLPIISYELFSKKYNLIYNTLIRDNGAQAFKPYPLSAVSYNWGWGLVLGNNNQKGIEIGNYYKFYTFIPNYNKDLYDGIIDFNDPITTLSKDISDINQWQSFAGDMETIIGSNLYQNIKFSS